MSRIGKNPVAVPAGVTVDLRGQEVAARGKLGELKMVLVDDVLAEMVDGQVVVRPRDSSTRARAMWGMSRTLISNLVVGVAEGFSKTLQLEGVGYRAQVQGKTLVLQLGFSHDVIYPIPQGIDIKCENPTTVVVSGADRRQVGQVAAEIRSYRPPEPYKGKGVRYAGEFILRKEGKKK